MITFSSTRLLSGYNLFISFSYLSFAICFWRVVVFVNELNNNLLVFLVLSLQHPFTKTRNWSHTMVRAGTPTLTLIIIVCLRILLTHHSIHIKAD